MSRGKKILLFKGEKYDYESLIINYYEDTFNENFKDGDVEDLSNGDTFDIADISDRYLTLNDGILENTDHLSHLQRGKIRNILNNKALSFRKKLLNHKLIEDTITKEQLEELIMIEDNKNISKEFYDNEGLKADIINNHFVKISQENPLPKDLKIPDVGRFHRLLEVMIKRNAIKRTSHGNSGDIKRSELMEHLECNISTFKTFIKKLENNSIIRLYAIPKSNRKIIFINPIYAHRELVISKELYNVFKDVLDIKLDRKLSKYMEIVYSEKESSGSVAYEDD